MRHINYLVLLLVACCVGACSSPKNDIKDAYPMFGPGWITNPE